MSEVKARPVITMQPVESKQIAAIGHDAATNTLAIEFKSWKPEQPNSLYHYANFTSDQFAAFNAAESKGNHFATHIKHATDKHPFERI